MTETIKDQEISYVHTTCRKCVFAQFTRNRQVDCSLKKLDDYRNAGIPVLEVVDQEGTEFYLIDGRFCLFYRTPELMENYPRNSWEDIVLSTTKCPYHAIIFFEPGDTFADLKRTLRNLKSEQEVEPNLITVINKQYINYEEAKASPEPNPFVSSTKILDLLQDLHLHQFSLKNVYNEDVSDRGLIDLAFDSASKLPYPFYVVFRASFTIPTSFSKELNDAILIKMLQIGVGTPVDDLNGLIVNRTTHKKHGGNAFGINLEDKVQQYEESDKQFIYEASEVCPSLKSQS